MNAYKYHSPTHPPFIHSFIHSLTHSKLQQTIQPIISSTTQFIQGSLKTCKDWKYKTRDALSKREQAKSRIESSSSQSKFDSISNKTNQFQYDLQQSELGLDATLKEFTNHLKETLDEVMILVLNQLTNCADAQRTKAQENMEYLNATQSQVTALHSFVDVVSSHLCTCWSG